MTHFFLQILIYLGAAIVAVPLAKRFGLGSILGYLIAGVVIGPVIGLVGHETHQIQHYAEFGVVMMLFLIGLELEPKMLWSMRHRLIGLGGLQILLTTIAFMLISLAFGFDWQMAVVIGFIFAPSSTAIVMQSLGEKGLSKTEGGQSAFSVLLFQDIAIIPMLALIPLLAIAELVTSGTGTADAAAQHGELSLVAGLPGWGYALVVIASIVSVIIAGNYLSRPLFKYVARSGLREIFTASALMLVIAVAALMSLVGLSPALGAFLAGVVLANSEFRHELEADIEPFKGLLLGLFFITIGAGIELELLVNNLGTVLFFTLIMMGVKVVVLLLLSFVFKIRNVNRWLFSLSLAQTGVFSFVLINYALQNGALDPRYAGIASLVVALSMFFTPGLFIIYEKLIVPRFVESKNKRAADEIKEQGRVIIAGGGRFGQVILVANGVLTTVLDQDADTIDMLRRIKTKSYFGDASRHGLLTTAGIDKADLLVVAIDNLEVRKELVRYVKSNYPHVKILGRAFDRGDAYQLRSQGADWVISETLHSALQTGAQALRELEVHPFRVEQYLESYRHVETTNSEILYQAWIGDSETGERNDNNFLQLFLQYEEQIAQVMRAEREDTESRSERGWTPPPKFTAEEE